MALNSKCFYVAMNAQLKRMVKGLPVSQSSREFRGSIKGSEVNLLTKFFIDC